MSLSPTVLLSNQAREKCIERLKALPAFTYQEKNNKTNAAVLVPLCIQNDQVHLLYTLRSLHLKSHSGQVSYPGGKMDDGERIIDAALRETEEEIGVTRDLINVWCEMPMVQGRDKNMIITPVVGFINHFEMKNLKPNLCEVEEIFTVSMNSLCDTNNHAHMLFKDMLLPIFVSGKHKIWGITGLITHLFLQNFIPDNIYKPNFTRKEYKMDELLPSKL